MADVGNASYIQEIRDLISQYLDGSQHILASYPPRPENWEEKFL
jgi:hypothetical protein